MNYSIHFRRGDACEHDASRECTTCFKSEMRAVFGAVCDGDFSEAWADRTVVGNEDGVDSFEVFAAR